MDSWQGISFGILPRHCPPVRSSSRSHQMLRRREVGRARWGEAVRNVERDIT